MNNDPDGDFKLVPLQLSHIDEEYVSWFDNADGHLDYFTGSGRSFSKEVIEQDFQAGIAAKSWFYYLIESSNGDKIGNIKIGPIDKKNRTSDLVCFVGNRKYLGKGIASRAIRLANKIAFEAYDIRRLQGGMYSSNVPSIKAYTKAGWYIEATLKGYYWIDSRSEDRICVACLNPKYFPDDIEHT